MNTPEYVNSKEARMGTLVRDELSGEMFEAEEVRDVTRGVLARDTWFKPFEVVRVGFRAEPAPHREAWARATDGGEERWMPVEVLQ